MNSFKPRAIILLLQHCLPENYNSIEKVTHQESANKNTDNTSPPFICIFQYRIFSIVTLIQGSKNCRSVKYWMKLTNHNIRLYCACLQNILLSTNLSVSKGINILWLNSEYSYAQESILNTVVTVPQNIYLLKSDWCSINDHFRYNFLDIQKQWQYFLVRMTL